jgi:CDGSH iron-sulfur domain-containing protein 3
MTDKFTNEGPLAVELDAGEHLGCACGKSSTFPLCDRAAHKGSGIGPTHFTLDEKKTVHLCRCGKTGNKPYCDGSHHKL